MARQTNMQRRHFELIAKTIKELPLEQEQRRIVAKQFADALATNAGFDKARFYLAADASWESAAQ